MTQPYPTTTPFDRTNAARPIQRTLIVTLGPLAAAVGQHLPAAFEAGGDLAGAVALLHVGGQSGDLTAAVRERLAAISRAGGRADLAAAGYVLDRRRELALFVLVDLTDPGVASQAGAVAEMVSDLARDGWGLDTRLTVIALAADWADQAPRQGLQALADTTQDIAAATIPLNHVNEEGLELDSPEAYARAGAAVVEVLVATPLRDALQWSGSMPEPPLTGSTLTAVGLARWTWAPEPVRDAEAASWRSAIIDQWLSPAQAEQDIVAAQRAGSWFGSQGYLPQALVTQLERAVAAYEVPAWSVPYPWHAAQAIDRLRNLSAALAGGRAGAVELVLSDWEEWPVEQEAVLRGELAVQLDQEPVAGFDLAGRFLQALSRAADDAAGVVAYRQDQLEEQARDLVNQLAEVLESIDAILHKWPPGSPADWLSLIGRPWRWPGLAWEYWRLHNLARDLEQLVARQATIEREQVVLAAVTALYGQYETAVGHTGAHLDEVTEMLRAGRPPIAEQRSDLLPVGRLVADVNPELEAAAAATALGGLGRLALALDDSLVDRLQALSLERFQFLIDLPAVRALERKLADEAAIAGWWHERWAEATPLWLYDDACQPEESRGLDRSWTAVCAAEINRLQDLLGLPDRPDWRWLPTNDQYHIDVLRWRTGVAI